MFSAACLSEGILRASRLVVGRITLNGFQKWEFDLVLKFFKSRPVVRGGGTTFHTFLRKYLIPEKIKYCFSITHTQMNLPSPHKKSCCDHPGQYCITSSYNQVGSLGSVPYLGPLLKLRRSSNMSIPWSSLVTPGSLNLHFF